MYISVITGYLCQAKKNGNVPISEPILELETQANVPPPIGLLPNIKTCFSMTQLSYTVLYLFCLNALPGSNAKQNSKG